MNFFLNTFVLWYVRVPSGGQGRDDTRAVQSIVGYVSILSSDLTLSIIETLLLSDSGVSSAKTCCHNSSSVTLVEVNRTRMRSTFVISFSLPNVSSTQGEGALTLIP